MESNSATPSLTTAKDRLTAFKWSLSGMSEARAPAQLEDFLKWAGPLAMVSHHDHHIVDRALVQQACLLTTVLFE